MTLQAEITASMRPRDLSAPTAFQRVLHKADWLIRERLITVLWAAFYPAVRRWARRLNSCGTAARIYIDPATGTVRPWMNLCGSRLCPFCGHGRILKVAGQIAEHIRHMTAPKSLTLTARDIDGHLADRIKLFKKAFRKLRQAELWKSTVRGGIYAVESTRNPDTGRWHVHLHIIIDSDYLHWQTLLAAWSQAIPGGERIWIRQITKADLAANHLAKYVSKPPAFQAWPDHAIIEYARSVNGARMLQTFGATYGKPIDESPPQAGPSPDRYSVSVPRLVKLARRGVQEARDLVASIATRWPVFAPFVRYALKDLPVNRHSPPAEDVPALDRSLFLQFTIWKDLDDNAQLPDSPGRWSYAPDPDEADYT